MAKSDTQMTVYRRGRREETVQVMADLGDTGALRGLLRGWLEAGRWPDRMAGEFEAEFREGERRPVRISAL